MTFGMLKLTIQVAPKKQLLLTVE